MCFHRSHFSLTFSCPSLSSNLSCGCLRYGPGVWHCGLAPTCVPFKTCCSAWLSNPFHWCLQLLQIVLKLLLPTESFACRACSMPLFPGVSGHKGEEIPHLSPYEGHQPKGTFWISNNQHLFLWKFNCEYPLSWFRDGQTKCQREQGLSQFFTYWEPSHTTWAEAPFLKEWGSTLPITRSFLWLRGGRVYRPRWEARSLRLPIPFSGSHHQPAL